MTAHSAAPGEAGPATGPATLPEPGFPPEEYAQRLFTARAAMERHGFDALLVTAPEDVHYLCGLDHQGHFALTALVVPLYGRPVLIERAMETPTALAQTHGVTHHGYDDATDPADALLEALTPLLPDAPVVGYQPASLSLPPAAWDRLRTAAGIVWTDGQDLLGGQRAVHTPREIARIREAARLSDTAMAAGLDAARAGAGEHEIAAAVYAAMLTAGGDLPAFAPLVRDTGRLDREHLTWSRRRLGPGDGVFLELSAARGRYHAPSPGSAPPPAPPERPGPPPPRAPPWTRCARRCAPAPPPNRSSTPGARSSRRPPANRTRATTAATWSASASHPAGWAAPAPCAQATPWNCAPG